MPVIIQYLLKLSLSVAVIHAFYYLVLRRLTFYNLNRWYLLGYSLLCFAIPLINVARVANEAGRALPAMHYIPTVQNIKGYYTAPTIAAHYHLNIWDAILGILAIGSLFMFVKFLMQLASFIRIKNKAEVISDDGTVIYHVDEQIAPFSFGSSIYLNKNMHTGRELEEIILHEYVHVKQRHTTDVLVAELLCILNWYNPFAWFMRHSIKQNLEFIADDNVVRAGMDKKAYQYHLLKVVGIPQYRIANQFNFSSLKKRIMMMNRAKTAKIHLVKFLFILPLMAVTLMAFRQEITKTISRNLPPGVKNSIKATLNNSIAQLPATMVNIPDTVVKNKLKIENMSKGAYQLSCSAADSTHVDKRQGFIILYGNASITNSTGRLKGPVIKLNNYADKNNILDFRNAMVLADMKRSSIADIDPSQVESVIVLQSGAAIQLFGDKGKYGAILYNLKHGNTAAGDTAKHYWVDVYSTKYAKTATKPAKSGYGFTVTWDSKSQSSSGNGNSLSATNTPMIAGVAYSSSSTGSSSTDTSIHALPGKVNRSSFSTGSGKTYNSANVKTVTLYNVSSGNDVQYHTWATGKGQIVADDPDAMVFVIDPKNVESSQFDDIIKAFKENGFNLKFRQQYNGKVLHTLGITLASNKGTSSTSATSTFTIDSMQDGKSLIKIIADKKTGDIAITTVPAGNKL